MYRTRPRNARPNLSYEILTISWHSTSRGFRRDAEHIIGELVLGSRDFEAPQPPLYPSQQTILIRVA